MMKTVLSDRALEDLICWKTADPQMCSRILGILQDISANGKPATRSEQLRGRKDTWSLRLDADNRLVYTVTDALYVAQCRGHIETPDAVTAKTLQDAAEGRDVHGAYDTVEDLMRSLDGE